MDKEYKFHIVEAEEKLSIIARQYGVSVEELKKANPEMKIFGGFFGGGTEYASAMQKIRIPIIEELTIYTVSEQKQVEKLNFKPFARYRCEQLNMSRIKQEIITFSANINTEYLFYTGLENEKKLKVSLEDYNLSVEPIQFKGAFEFGEKIERIKDEICFTQNNKGEIKEILNIQELKKKWDNFRDKQLPINSLYKNLKEKTPEQAKDIITTGNKEFYSSELLGSSLGKNLFFHILLRANVGEELQNYNLKQYSQLFPNLELNTTVVKSKVKEESGKTTYRLVGTLDKDNISDNKLEKMYDELYKPVIKYGYTEFSYIYRITYIIENKNNLLLDAKASLCEKIKNNFEAITEFSIKKVEL